MSIEKSPAPAATHKPAASTSGHAARTKALAADGAPDAGGAAGGFLAILGAMDAASAAAAEPLATGVRPDEAPALDGAASLATGLASLAPVATPADTPAPAPGTTPWDISALLQQNPQIAAAQAAGTAPSVPDPALLAQALAAAGLTQAPAPAPVAGSAGGATSLAPGAARVSASGPAAAAQAVPGAEAPDLAEPATQTLQHAFARARAGRESLQAGGDAAGAASSSAAAPGERAEARQFMAMLERSSEPSAARAAEPVLAPLLVRQEKTQAERRDPLGHSSDPTYAGSTLGLGLPEASQSGAAAPVLAPEMQVAEQVSYWVAHNVQNAELSLDGLGQLPVQVSISLQGNEAHISFRTDETAAREVLQSAAAHLKDLLQGEGLVLAGVSVGSSGSGNADGSERRARPNARQTALAPLQTAAADSGPRVRSTATGAAGRSVDLFV